MIEVLFYLVVLSACFMTFVNSVVLVFLAARIVRAEERQREFFGDVVNVMEDITEEAPPPVVEDLPKNTKNKTWDEKYEEEMAAIDRYRIKQAGLMDLPGPKADYGEGPAATKQEGLTVRDNS